MREIGMRSEQMVTAGKKWHNIFSALKAYYRVDNMKNTHKTHNNVNRTNNSHP